MSTATDLAATAGVVIVGASLAGLRTVESLRALGHTGQITVLGDEPHPPYDRPPLSKAALVGARSSAADVAREFALARRADDATTWRLGTRVQRADLGTSTLHLADGGLVAFDVLVAATGLRPRTLGLPGPSNGRHTIRTADDAHRLGGALAPGSRLVIIGASFIGCEIAYVASSLGVAVSVVDPCAEPMDRVLGPELGAAVRRRHEALGTTFHLGRLPTAYLGSGDSDVVTGVELDDGTRVLADVVVEAVGCRPETGWLGGNGLDLSDGVLTDDRLRAVGAERLLAVGDVARFPNRFVDDVPRRVEHWAIAGDTARQAAATILGETGDFAPVPSFWSDQLGTRIQGYGAPSLGDDRRLVAGDLSDPNQPLQAVMEVLRDGRRVGVVGVGLRKQLMQARAALVQDRQAADAAV